jgi:hypothetical protein
MTDKAKVSINRYKTAMEKFGIPFNPLTALGRLYQQLLDEQAHPRSKVFARLGVKNPQSRLDAVRRRGEYTGKWRIKSEGGSLRLILRDRRLRSFKG